MKGMRKRVTIAFFSIVALLFLSGMLSLIELNRLSRDTEDILRANQRNISLAKEMLDAAHRQNMAYIRVAIYRDWHYDSVCRNSMTRLEECVATARAEAIDSTMLDTLTLATSSLKQLTERELQRFALQREREEQVARMAALQYVVDTLSSVEVIDTVVAQKVVAPAPTVADFVEQEQYEQTFSSLTSAIQDYMTSTQGSLAPRTEQLKKNAYRAVTPVLISLGVMILIVLLLYYFMMHYCVNPIVRIARSLSEFVQFRMPYRPKGDFQDELKEINESIDTITSLSRQQRQ